ncbi:MAG: PAS domain-containing protein [Rhodospirillales bacterium]|nr:PAS domain-containing protein [Rhodospirillales bacterium]
MNGDARAVARAVCQPLLVLADDLTVEVANPAFCEVFGTEPERDEGGKLFEIGNGRWAIRPLQELLENVLRTGSGGRELRIEHSIDGLGRRILLASACPARFADGSRHILLTIADATAAEGLRVELEGEKELAGKIFDAARDALIVLRQDLRVQAANETFYTKFQVDPHETEGRLIYELGNGQWNIPRLRDLLETILPANDSFDDFFVEHDFRQIGHRVMLLNARRVDHLQLILLAIEDVTERTRVEEARRAGEERLRRVLETDAVGVMFFDATGTLVDANDVFLRMTGYTREEVKARELTWRRMTPAKWVEISEAQMQKLAETGRIGPYEKEYILKDGSYSWMMFAGRQLDDRTLVEYCIDISDRKHAEMERELLIHELSHRVKNVFAVIQSMATQSRARNQTAISFRQAFLDRLAALARAHCMLLDAEWQGATLDMLVANAVQAYLIDHPEAITVAGEPIALTPGHSVAISMVLHELGTNAAKYGALSHSNGRLRVEWRNADLHGRPEVELIWEERGGTGVAPPAERGFGSQLIEQAVSYQLGGRVTMDYAPEGLVCRISFPLK